MTHRQRVATDDFTTQQARDLHVLYNSIRHFRAIVLQHAKVSVYRELADRVSMFVRQQMLSPFYNAELNQHLVTAALAVEEVLPKMAGIQRRPPRATPLKIKDIFLTQATACVLAALLRIARAGPRGPADADIQVQALRAQAERLEAQITQVYGPQSRFFAPTLDAGLSERLQFTYIHLTSLATQTLLFAEGRANHTLGIRLLRLTSEQLQSATLDHARAEQLLDVCAQLRLRLLGLAVRTTQGDLNYTGSDENNWVVAAAVLCSDLIGVMCRSVEDSHYHARWREVLYGCHRQLTDFLHNHPAAVDSPARFSQRNPPNRDVQLALLRQASSDVDEFPAGGPDEAHFVYSDFVLTAIRPDGQRRDFDLIGVGDKYHVPHLKYAPHIVADTDPPRVRYIDCTGQPRELRYNPETAHYDCYGLETDPSETSNPSGTSSEG